MRWKPILFVAIVAASAGWVCQSAQAGDLRITLPKRSQPTPVQRLNREGVRAIRKHQYKKAETLFYKAYLFDPDDPFTLNNLGYISELQGQVERAQRFYSLAAQLATDAVIDRASSRQVEGKAIKDVVRVPEGPLEINQANVEVVRLLSKDRAAEADLLLQRTLTMDPNNVFALNNMGVVKEMEGEYEDALRYYRAAADTHSSKPVTVTVNSRWRGKAVSEMAATSARKMSERMQSTETAEAKAAVLNLRGVSAMNRNDWRDAGQDFRQAFALDPNGAFSLNNIGFLSEMEGDRETAEFFYDKAQKANKAGARVGLATSRSAEGMKLFEVAGDSDQKVDTQLTQEREASLHQSGPIELKRRDNTSVVEPEQSLQSPGSPLPQQPAPLPQESPTLGPPPPPIPQLSPQTPPSTPPRPPDADNHP